MLEPHYQLTDQGHAFENGSSVFLAQVREKSSGVLLTPDRIEAIRYNVYRLDHSDPAVKAVIPGHDDVSLVVDEVFFETPILDGLWDADTTGYNFKHEPVVSVSPLFPTAGRHYLVEYRLALTDHPNDVIIRYRIHAI
ncbi:MAG: hypothetical protein FWC43_03270 [Planctomycetaceae bacterium]|nr:hypothetical protein [Planctomycetaceae bacterium]